VSFWKTFVTQTSLPAPATCDMINQRIGKYEFRDTLKVVKSWVRLCRRIWPMNSSSPRISGSEPAYTMAVDHSTACPSHTRRYTAVDCRRPSFSCSRCPHLARPAAPRHVRIISGCFPKPSEDAPLPAFFSVTFVQCLRSDSCHN